MRYQSAFDANLPSAPVAQGPQSAGDYARAHRVRMAMGATPSVQGAQPDSAQLARAALARETRRDEMNTRHSRFMGGPLWN